MYFPFHFTQSAQHSIEIQNNNHRITTEVANMMAKLEATKNDLLKYFAGKIMYFAFF